MGETKIALNGEAVSEALFFADGGGLQAEVNGESRAHRGARGLLRHRRKKVAVMPRRCRTQGHSTT
jgi:hypothetical protein